MPSTNGASRELSVGIVGAGFGGVGIGIRLRQAGFENFRSSSAATRVGGVWRANTYPGAACDVPVPPLLVLVRPGHDWTRRYAPQAEILAYLKATADRFAVTPHMRFGTEVDRGDVRLAGGELDARDRRRRAPLVRRARHRLRPADAPVDPGAPRARRVRRPELSLGRMGPRRRSSRPQRRGGRHRRERDPVRPGDRAGRRADDDLPALGAVDPRQGRPHLRRLGAAAVRARSRLRVAAAARGQLRRLRAARARAHRPHAAAATRSRHGQPRAREGARGRSGAARQGDARLRDRLQARPAHRRLVPDAAPRRR